MFQRAVAITALMIGIMGAPGGALAQFLPPLPPLGTAPRPMPPMPPVDNDADLPPYDPPPGYRAPAQSPYGQPRTYESEALPPPGPYAAPGREPAYPPPQGQYGAAPGYPPGQPAYDPPPGYQEPRGPAPRPQYGAVPPQDNALRPPMGVGPGGQPVEGEPEYTSRLPMDVRPETGPRKELPSQFRRTTVEYRTREPAGTIIVDTQNTYLYLVLGNGQAIRYGIGVGREGFTWSGAQKVTRMAEWPDWHPPPEMIERQPYLPRFMAGGEGNPLGARALYLGATIYRIHGTNAPSTIGSRATAGCIRMVNDDVIDLYDRVKVGAKVVVLPAAERHASGWFGTYR